MNKSVSEDIPQTPAIRDVDSRQFSILFLLRFTAAVAIAIMVTRWAVDESTPNIKIPIPISGATLFLGLCIAPLVYLWSGCCSIGHLFKFAEASCFGLAALILSILGTAMAFNVVWIGTIPHAASVNVGAIAIVSVCLSTAARIGSAAMQRSSHVANFNKRVWHATLTAVPFWWALVELVKR